MNTIVLLCVILIFIYSCVSWLFPTLLSWLVKRKYHINLKIGHIVVPKLILKDVIISKDDLWNLHIDQISVKSSLFNSDINKLVLLQITNLKISNNVEEKRSVVVETILKPLLSKQNSSNLKSEDNVSLDSVESQLQLKKQLDFRDATVPPSLIMFAQFMGLHIYNANLLLNSNEGVSLQSSAAEIHADGAAGGPVKNLVFSANFVNANINIYKDDCKVVEVSKSLLIEGTVKSEGPLSVEKIHATLTKPKVVVNWDCAILLSKWKRKSSKKVYVQNEDNTDVLQRLSPVIPKIFSLKMDKSLVRCLEEHTYNNLIMSFDSLIANSRFSTSVLAVEMVEKSKVSLPQVYVAFQVDQLKIHSSKEELVFLNKMKLDGKLEKGILNLYLILNELDFNYNHQEVFFWFSHFVKGKKSEVLKLKQETKSIKWYEEILSACLIQGCAELRTAKISSRFDDRYCNMGFTALKMKIDQLHNNGDDSWWSAELLWEGAWVGTSPGSNSRRSHSPKAAALNVALLKCATHALNDWKVEAMMDCLRFEWNHTLADTLNIIINSLKEYKINSHPTLKDYEPKAKYNITMNIALSHINMFLLVNETSCLMARINAISLDRNVNKFGAMISGLKVVDMSPPKGPVSCHRSEDIKKSFFHLKLARIEHLTDSTNISTMHIQIIENIDFEWSANIHLKIVHFTRDLIQSLEKLKLKKSKTSSAILNWRVTINNEVNLLLMFSKENSVVFSTDDLSVSYDSKMGLSIIWNALRMVLNGNELVNVYGFSMERLMDDQEIRVERKANEGFQLPWNKVWDINVESIRVVFPYKHRFAEAIQGEMVSHFKWLKEVHNIKKKPFTADSPLPSDLFIKIDEILIEMSDDPFEVKLRDNYELLEDEYKESEKRRSMLDAKVQELCKPHLFLPAGKVEELYLALRQKDAQIYVQRSKAAPPGRSRLCGCTLQGIRLIALADPSIHGTERAEKKMKAIDYDSAWPSEGLEFVTLWCRAMSLNVAQWQLVLRDFPQPLLSVEGLKMWGTVMAAEEKPPPRAVRTVSIDLGVPFGSYSLDRSMMPLKWYCDLCCEVRELVCSYGPCWEPVIAQCNLAFEQISRPSLDPSLPLSWWDKIRLLLHGRLTANFNKYSFLLRMSLDPYNKTEEMEITWADLVLDWINGRIGVRGALLVVARAGLLHEHVRLCSCPFVRLNVRLQFICAGASSHHLVAPCAPHKLPDYSSNQEHDSYRAFRSQGLDVHLSMDTKPQDNDGPVILLYGSTFRWLESLKYTLSGVSRPIRRGRVFRNERPRKTPLSRHYRSLSVSLTVHNLQVFYWASSSMQRGIEMLCSRVTCSSKHSLSLVAYNDGLIQRPRANWTTMYMNCDLIDVEIWLKTTTANEKEKEQDADRLSNSTISAGMEKCFSVSVRRVSYGRESSTNESEAAAHRLAVHDLRGAWTKQNRDLAFELIDTYIKNQQLKKNLSTKALKEEEKPSTSPMHQRETEIVSPPPNSMQQGSALGGSMLSALVATRCAGEVVLGHELSAAESHPRHHARHNLEANARTACLIELVNSQVVLKGCESRGYVVVCAARAEVRKRVQLAPQATEWSGHLTHMQYYATVSDRPHLDENIQWVSVEEIEEREACLGSIPDVPRLLGQGHSAGGVIGPTVGPSTDAGLTQLQRIVSRCACEFYFVSQSFAQSDEPSVEPSDELSASSPHDCFTLVHHDLDVCTNSLQYAMLLDVINNVVLHVEPGRRRTLEQRARMRFQLQLHQDTDPRKLIHKLQTQVRESLARLRKLEKEYYLKSRTLGNDPASLEELKTLDAQVSECKEAVWSSGEELDCMVRAWRDNRGPRAGDKMALDQQIPLRHNEICFKSAKWRLTDADGQLGIADMLLTNFLYTKTSRSDDSVEHQLELGYVRVANLLPNEPFPEVLVPQEPLGRAPLCRRAALRVFCRDRPPVGGISVKEHFEVNIVPFKIGLTKKFFNTMLKFCFPERDPDTIEGENEDDTDGTKPGSSTSTLVSTGSKKIKKKNKDSNSNFYVKRDKKDKDDVEKMKERAEKNKLFIYIKIPEVPVRVSYKGSKEKNLEDVRDLPLVLPTLEYHNVTWTWLDLLLATKTDTRRVIVSQAIRQKLQLHRRAAATPEPQEEDKARMLLGDRTLTESKPQKKLTQGVFKFNKS